MLLWILITNKVFVTSKIFIINKVNSIKSGYKLIEKFIKPKIRKLFKS